MIDKATAARVKKVFEDIVADDKVSIYEFDHLLRVANGDGAMNVQHVDSFLNTYGDKAKRKTTGADTFYLIDRFTIGPDLAFDREIISDALWISLGFAKKRQHTYCFDTISASRFRTYFKLPKA